MQDSTVSTFGGVAGRVLSATFSWGTLLTALVVAFTIALEISIFAALRNPLGAALVTMAIVLLVQARFAVSGYHGQWRGSILSPEGGSFKEAAFVALRFFALFMVWLAPLVLGTIVYGIGLGVSAAAMDALNMQVPRPPIVLMAYAMSFVIAQPMMLIVAVAAEDFASVFSPTHWSSTLAGRWGDLFALCAVNAGGPLIIYLLASPLLMGVAANGVQATLAVGAIFLGFIGAFWVTLFGRLCGFFARGATDVEAYADHSAAPAAGPRIAPGHGPGARGVAVGLGAVPGAGAPPLPSAGLPGSVPPPPAPPGPPAPGAAPAAPAAPAASIPLSPVETEGPPPPVAPTPPTGPETPPAASMANTPPVPGTAVFATTVPLGVVPPNLPGGGITPGPPLLDAEARIAQARGIHETDPDGAIAELEELRRSHAPHPGVLAALAEMLAGRGESERAEEAAREALRVGLDAGQTGAASEALRVVIARCGELGLTNEELLLLAGELKGAGDLRTAARVYAFVVQDMPAEIRAIKALLQIAELMARDARALPSAVKIYRFLLEQAGDSPLAVYMQEGLADAERKMKALDPA